MRILISIFIGALSFIFLAPLNAPLEARVNVMGQAQIQAQMQRQNAQQSARLHSQNRANSRSQAHSNSQSGIYQGDWIQPAIPQDPDYTRQIMPPGSLDWKAYYWSLAK